MYKHLLAIACLLISCTCIAVSRVGSQEQQFVYIKSNEVNLRVGPGIKYAIKWVIKSKYEPVIVLVRFEDWIKVKDVDADEGWIKEAMVSYTSKGAIITGDGPVVMYRSASLSSRKIVRLEPKVRVRVKKCSDEGWCKVSIDRLNGWVPKTHLWGVD